MAKDTITFGVGWGTKLPPLEHVKLSILAKTLGYDGVWPGDNPTSRSPGHDPHILLSYIAGHTERVKLGTAIYVLPLSHPVRLAKQMVAMDSIANALLVQR